MILKVFWKKDCPNCPRAKELGKKLEDDIKVQYCNIDTIDGLSEACMLNVMSTPTMILVDDENNEMESWRGLVPKFEQIKERIS